MARKRTSEKGALELLEEAVHLLRLAPAPTLLCYYLGALPFVLGFLFFWADMSRSAFAAQHIGRAAFALTLLFIWMKVWQTIFADQLTSQITGKISAPFTFSRIRRVVLAQTIFQPSAFFVLPIAFLIMLPFGWAFAFYQNLIVFAGGSKPLFKTAARQSGIFPKQNHVGLLVLSAFAFFVWLNLAMLLFLTPGLLKTFLGIENAFTRSGWLAIANTTFFATSFAMTFLCVDPLVKSFYALRCFYGQAVATGEDLKVELKSRAPKAAATLALLFLLSQNALANSPQNAIPNSAPNISVSKLDRSIERVLNQPEFTWRLPREKTEAVSTQKNWFVLFVESVFQTLLNWIRSLRDLFRDFFEWLGKFFRSKESDHEKSSSSGAWMTTLQISVFILIALLASALTILLFRMWQHREKKEVVLAQAISPTPDLNDENLAASQLPEDGWLKLAREWMEKGDLRLALRALYLASLAHLAQREFLSVAKFKSNREYEQELRRRARALPELQTAFSQNVSAFDRAWYGMHEVTHEILQGFQSNMERIRAC